AGPRPSKAGPPLLLRSCGPWPFGPRVRDDDLEVLQVGSPEEHSTIAVCSAGTRLGEAFLVRGGEGRRGFPRGGGTRASAAATRSRSNSSASSHAKTS